MGMHVAGDKPDWEKIPPEEWNVFQRVASRTDGIVTPGNVLTATKTAFVLWGNAELLRGGGRRLWKPLALIAIGRTFDIADGLAAEMTGTKSPKGKIFDASTDKIESITTVSNLAYNKLIPKEVAVPLVASQVAITAGGIYAYLKGRQEIIQPSAKGKAFMLDINLAIGSDLLSTASERGSHNKISKIAKLGAGILYKFALASGADIAADYPARFKKLNKNIEI
jgi:phosphatidylglycerophosphate synthase